MVLAQGAAPLRAHYQEGHLMPRNVEIDTKAFERAFEGAMRKALDGAAARLGLAEERIRRGVVERVHGVSGETEASLETESGRVKDALLFTEIKVGGAAVPLEFGTSRMAPRPFFRPSLEEGAEAFKGR